MRGNVTGGVKALGLIAYLTESGSSLMMNWGEDTEAWEVDWIADGQRWRGCHRLLSEALDQVLTAAADAARGEEVRE